MHVEVVRDEAALGLRAADIVCDVARLKPDAIIALPTGTTPLRAYAELQRRSDVGAIDVRGVTVIAVDEFCAEQRDARGTNAAFFREHLRLPLFALHVPDASTPDADGHIAGFAQGVRDAGGIDLCVLGVGVNGHVAFNEPGSPRDAPARVVDLAPATREAHAEAFGGMELVPHRGMTLGIADLLAARAVLVLAEGARKADVVRAALQRPPAAAVPASWLQSHPEITWLLDRPAAVKLD